MSDLPGMARPDIQSLPQARDRMTFLYLERCAINRQDSAITATDEKGVVHIPAASIGALLLGPGTNITHRAMELIGDNGVTIVWVGENGVRCYASGRPLTHKANLLLKQAELVVNTRSHLDVVRRMYQMRFPDEDVSLLTTQQLRGREGARIRTLYRAESRKWKVPWSGRVYDAEDFSSGDPVNQALSAGHTCLYGLAHAVIVALGCSPGLGFVHVGHEYSFVYDIADLYKAEVTIPLAFEIAASEPNEEIAAAMRRRTRDEMTKRRLLERMVRDIHALLQSPEEQAEAEPSNVVALWDARTGSVANGISYRDARWEDEEQ